MADLTTDPQIRVLAAAIRARVPLIAYGNPGAAKTAKTTEMARQWGYHTEVLTGSNRQPEDFLGLPEARDGKTAYLDLDWAVRLNEAPRALGIFDEFNTGGDVFKAMLRVFGERWVGDLELADTVSLIALANPTDVAVDGVDLPAPIANRFVHMDWKFDADEWLSGVLDNFATVAYPSMASLLGPDDEDHRKAVRAQFVAYLKSSPASIDPGVPKDYFERESKAYPSPRSWTLAMNLAAELDRGDDGAWMLAVKGAVGETEAVRFMHWREANDLIDPLQAIAHPERVDFTDTRTDRIYALLFAAESIGAANPERWRGALHLVTLCAEKNRPDIALASASRLLNTIPDGQNVPKRARDAFADLLTDTGLWTAAA